MYINYVKCRVTSQVAMVGKFPWEAPTASALLIFFCFPFVTVGKSQTTFWVLHLRFQKNIFPQIKDLNYSIKGLNKNSLIVEDYSTEKG